MRGLLLALVFLCSTLAAAASNADGGRHGWTSQGLQRVAERELSVEQAAQIAQRAVGGRVLGAERATMGGRSVVRVKLLTRQGVVRVVVVDAATGRLL